MSEKTKPTEDLLERSIIDAKKVKQVAFQSAERALKQKFSKDLKKIYLNKLNEEADIDFGEDLLEEEYSMLGEEEDPFGDEDPMGGAGGGDMGGAGGGDMGGGGLDGGGPPPSGGGLDQGPAPAPNSISPIEPQIPTTHDDITLPNGTEPDEIELELIFDKDQSLPGDVNQFMQNDTEQPSGMDDGMGEEDPFGGGMGEEDPFGGGMGEQTPSGLDGPGMPGEEEGIDFGFGDEDPNQQMNPRQNNGKGFDMASIQLDDDVLLDYINNSLKNDELTRRMQADLLLVSEQVNLLSKQLDKSNSTLELLQRQNLRLIYQNKTLIDDSLSEHQKQHIVKALDKAATLNEAKVIFETAKSSTRTKPEGNLNKIHGTRATGTTNLLRENKGSLLPQADRWQELAGIKKSK